MSDEQNQQAVTRALDALIEEAGGVRESITPPGYSHLGLSILDSIYSLRSNYDTVVVPALKRYCSEIDLDWNHRDDAQPEHGARALASTLGGWSVDKRGEILTNHVAAGTTKRKSDVCIEVAEVLVDNGVDGHRSLALVLDQTPSLEWRVRAVRGVGPAAWRYILNLSRVEKVKPDTMIVRWVTGVVGELVGQADAARWLENAARSLSQEYAGLTVRQADHLVWRKESGRLPLGKQ